MKNQNVLSIDQADQVGSDDRRWRNQSVLRKPADDPRRAIVEVGSGNPDSGISTGDLLAMDFTVNKISFDGQYLISFDGDYLCLRTFQIMPAGLHIKQDGVFSKKCMVLSERFTARADAN